VEIRPGKKEGKFRLKINVTALWFEISNSHVPVAIVSVCHTCDASPGTYMYVEIISQLALRFLLSSSVLSALRQLQTWLIYDVTARNTYRRIQRQPGEETAGSSTVSLHVFTLSSHVC